MAIARPFGPAQIHLAVFAQGELSEGREIMDATFFLPSTLRSHSHKYEHKAPLCRQSFEESQQPPTDV